MAVLRLLYRKRRVLLMLVFMSLFWVVFLYLSMPASSGYEKKKSDRDKMLQEGKVLVKEAAEAEKQHKHESENRNQIEKVIRSTQNNHKPAAPLQPPNMHIDSPILNSVNISSRSGSNHSRGVTTKSTKNIGQVDKMIEFGAQIKNKTFEVGAQVKNKTLQKLSDLGLIAKSKPVIKQIGKTSILNITMSKEEIMFVIKRLIMDAEKKPSDKVTHTVLPPAGRDNTNSSAGGLSSRNLCDCTNADCTCCAQLQLIKLHVVRKACANFTFMPKSQEMSFMFLLDGKTQFTEVISAEHPPKICLGSISKDVEICVDFFNMSFTVNMYEEHKTQLSGCLNFCFNIYNKTISTFPLGCFQIPSDSHKEDHQQIPLLGNWVP